MPRNPIISEVQAEDQATNSPVRRSSRLINGGINTTTPSGAITNGTPAEGDKPKPTRTRRLSTQSNESTDSKGTQPKNVAKPATRGRRGSVTSDTSEAEPPKTVRTRRGSTSKTQEPEDQPKPKPRGRRGSNASDLEVEVSKTPARATRRRGSATEEAATEVVGTPAKRGARGRKLSEDEDVKKPTTRGRKAPVTADEEQEIKEEVAAKPKRGRRSSVDHVEAPKTPARVTRSNSTGTNESKPEDIDSEVKEITVKLTPLKKRKLVEKVEAELDLSIINESGGDLNVTDPGTPKASPVKAELSPRRSPRLSTSKSSILNAPEQTEEAVIDNNTSRDSNKENVDIEVNTEDAGVLEQKPSLAKRVSNVFKPNQKECSFVVEPMDVDISLSVIAPDNSIMENMPSATDSVILSGNAPTATPSKSTDEKLQQSSLSLLNHTLTSSTHISDTENDDNNDLLIEETENTVSISFKKGSKIPDHSLVVNNTLDQLKVVLSGKASSPIIEKKRLRQSRSPNVTNSEPQKLRVSRGVRRSKSKSVSPNPPVKDGVTGDDSKAPQSPKTDAQITEVTTQTEEPNESSRLPTKADTPESPKNKSTEGHFADKDNNYEEILILNDELTQSSSSLNSTSRDQTQQLKLSESTYYDFHLSDTDDTNAEDKNMTETDQGPVSVCSQEDTVDLNLKSKDNSLQHDSDTTAPFVNLTSQEDDVDEETKNNDTAANLTESTALESDLEVKESRKIVENVNKTLAEDKCFKPKSEVKETADKVLQDECLKAESESALEVMETEETAENEIVAVDDSSEPESEPVVEVMESEENTENVSKNVVENECVKSKSVVEVMESKSNNVEQDECSKAESESALEVIETETTAKNVNKNVTEDVCSKSETVTVVEVTDSEENVSENECEKSKSESVVKVIESEAIDVEQDECSKAESESALEVIETETTAKNVNKNVTEDECSKSETVTVVEVTDSEENAENVSENVSENECEKSKSESVVKVIESEAIDVETDECSKAESESDLEVMESKETTENVNKNVSDDECSESEPALKVAEIEESVKEDTTQKIQEQKKVPPIKKSPPRKLKLDDFASTKLSEYLKSKQESLDESSESEEDYNEFIDGMAEECEEDTPSEDSNQIIDEGEYIGSSDSDQICEDDDYDPDDSFICDEEPIELLPGDEYDLSSEKKKPSKKGSRIIDPETLDVNNGIVTVPKKCSPKPKRSRIINIQNSSSEDEQENGVSVIVLNDTNVCQDHQNKTSNSVIVIDDTDDQLSTTKNTPPKVKTAQNSSLSEEAPTNKSEKAEESKETWQNVSLLQNISVNALTASAQKRNRKTSLTLTENIQVDNIKDPVLSQRINSLVQSFCSTIKKGEISLNLSLEYEDSQEPSPMESEEKTEAVHILSDVTLVTSEDKNPIPSVETDKLEKESDRMETENNELENVNLEAVNEVFEKGTAQEVVNVNNTSEEEDEELRRKRKKLKRRLSRSLSEVEAETKKSKRRKNNRKRRADSYSPDVDDLKTGTMNLMQQLVTDVKNRPKRIIKPSNSVPESAWNISPVSTLKPSTSSATRPKPHPKDFKNQLLNDPNRVRRIETKKLLKKKGIY